MGGVAVSATTAVSGPSVSRIAASRERQIAVAANAARVTVTGIIADHDPALVQGTLHTMEGWVIFVLDLVLLVALHAVINWVWKKWWGNKPENMTPEALPAV